MVSICGQREAAASTLVLCVSLCACAVCVCRARSLSHLEADVLEVAVELVQHSAAVEYEGRLQHLLVDLLVVQLLWGESGGYESSLPD